MAIQTSFTEKVAGSQDCNDRFLALLGNDGEFDLALLDVKNRVRDLRRTRRVPEKSTLQEEKRCEQLVQSRYCNVSNFEQFLGPQLAHAAHMRGDPREDGARCSKLLTPPLP